MVNYRKIYEDHYGEILKDELGRTYDIHHIDGNRSNNDISNLKAVSIKQHWEIHSMQGDHDAANLIAERLGLELYSGYKRPKHSERMTGKDNPMFGKLGKNNPNYGKKRPKQSEKLKGRKRPEFSEEWRKNISTGRLGMLKGEDNPMKKDEVLKKFYKKIDQFDMHGNFIKTWNSIKEAGESLNLDRGLISRCCANKRNVKIVGGFIWKYHISN
jgi:hypothetical protein